MITISPGHWRVGSGACDLIDEVTEARKVVNRVIEYLRSAKIAVNHIEDNSSTNQQQNLKYLVTEHNKTNRKLDVSVHFNAAARSTRGLGVEVLYYDQKELANNVSKAISDVSGLINRGAKERKELAFLNGTEKPAILIEVCFVSSEVDVALYRRDFDKICRAIANELAVYVGVNIGEGEKQLNFTSTTLKEKYEERIISPTTAKLIDDTAVEVLGYKTKLINGRLADGDLISTAIELAVHFAKQK